MLPKLANPAWPNKIIQIFNTTVAVTPLGCGQCGNAEWAGATDSSGHFFAVSVCRAGIPITDGEPKEYCTAFQCPPLNTTANPPTRSGLIGPPPLPMNRPY